MSREKNMRVQTGLTSCISLLILCGMCSGYPKGCFVNFYNSTRWAGKMSELVLEQCDSTDFRDPNEFPKFLRSLVDLHNMLISEQQDQPPNWTGLPKTTWLPEVHHPSVKPSPMPQPPGTSRTPAQHSGSPPIPSGMTHPEPGQTDSSNEGELFTVSWRPTGMEWMPTGGDDQSPHSESESWEPTGAAMGGNTVPGEAMSPHSESESWEPTGAAMGGNTVPGEAMHFGSPPIPSGMTHPEPGQTDSSNKGESPHSESESWEPTGAAMGGNTVPGEAMDTQSPSWTYKPIKQMNITMFLMLFHNLMKDMMYRPRLQECLEKTPSSEIAWRALQANLTNMARMEASILLMVVGRAMRRASAEEVEKLPVPQDIALIKAVMNQFHTVHCNQSKEARRAVYLWLKKGLKSIVCPERERPQGDRDDRTGQNKPPAGQCNWVNETTLGIVHLYIFDARPSDLKLITDQQMCRMFSNSQFAMALSLMYDMEPSIGRQLLHKITTSCLNITQPDHITRLGALACFVEDVESLDNITAKALLNQLSWCNNPNADQIARRLVKAAPLSKDLVQSMGQALSALPARQLATLSDQDVRDTIQVLAKVERFEARQSRLLVTKFFKAGGKLNSSRDLLELDNLIGGVSSKHLRDMGSEELLEAAKGGLEEHADKMTPLQKETIVMTILENADTSVVFKSLSPSLRKELPTSCIGKANITELEQVKDTEWNKGQALLLCDVLLKNDSIPADELGQLGSLAGGVTCEMFEQYAGSSAVNMSRSLGNVTAWLSRSQYVCVAKQLGSALDAYDPQALQDHVDTILDIIPSEILLYLSEQYICQTFASSCARYLEKMAEAPFELLPRSSLIRECVRDTAIGCLNKPMSELSEADLATLGGVLCEFSGHNVSQLQDTTFGASVSQFGKCSQFHPTAPTALAAKITTSLGNISMWTSETVTSLGPMVSFLNGDTLQQIPNTVDVNQVLSQLQASQGVLGPVTSPEFQTGFNLTVITVTIFTRLVEPTSEGNTQRRRRAASCTVTPSSDMIYQLGQANSEWTVEQLTCMSTETFSDSIGVLGSVLGFSPEQRSALIDKAIEAWGAASTFTQSEIASLQYLLSALSVTDLKSMDLSSLDNLDSIALCPSWTQDKRRAVLERYLELNGLTAARLDSIALSGLGNFLCGMNASQINALQGNAMELAAASLGKLTCPPETLGLLKEKFNAIFGGMSNWTEAQLSELGTIAAGASIEDLQSLQPAKMSHLSTDAIRLIPADRFKVLSVEQLKKLGPENAGAVTPEQMDMLTPEQKAAVNEALGVSAQKVLPYGMSRSPSLGVSGLVHMVATLLSVVLLSV